jgi:hypothetical protein
VQAITNVPELPEDLAAIFENFSNQLLCFIYFLLSLNIAYFVVLPAPSGTVWTCLVRPECPLVALHDLADRCRCFSNPVGRLLPHQFSL